MIDILKGLAGGGWPFLVSWIFPSTIASSIFSLWLFPELTHVSMARDIENLTAVQQALVLAFVCLTLGVLLSATSTVLYRILEGYYLLPTPVRQWKIRSQLQKKRKLAKRLEKCSASGNRIQESLLREKPHRFPTDDTQVAPTRLANSIRAFETYAYNRFHLDSQALWSELIASVPSSLKDDYEQSRAPVNFFVSLVYLSGALGVVALSTAWHTGFDRPRLIALGLGSMLLVPVWYWFATTSTRYWHSTVQAVVNVGRKELASKFGLRLPRTLKEERDMWEQVNWLVYEDFDESYIGDLDRFREDPREQNDLNNDQLTVEGIPSQSQAEGSRTEPEEEEEEEEEEAGES